MTKTHKKRDSNWACVTYLRIFTSAFLGIFPYPKPKAVGSVIYNITSDTPSLHL